MSLSDAHCLRGLFCLREFPAQLVRREVLSPVGGGPDSKQVFEEPRFNLEVIRREAARLTRCSLLRPRGCLASVVTIPSSAAFPLTCCCLLPRCRIGAADESWHGCGRPSASLGPQYSHAQAVRSSRLAAMLCTRVCTAFVGEFIRVYCAAAATCGLPDGVQRYLSRSPSNGDRLQVVARFGCDDMCVRRRPSFAHAGGGPAFAWGARVASGVGIVSGKPLLSVPRPVRGMRS